MHTDLQYDKALIGKLVGPVERTHGCTGQSQDGGLATRGLGDSEHAVDIVAALIRLETQVVDIDPVVALLIAMAQSGPHG